MQYCSQQYQQINLLMVLTCEMIGGYDCCQNTLAERISGVLKMNF